MDIIKTVSHDQQQIIRDICRLYCPEGIELDPTFSKGVFYKGDMQLPRLRFDIDPPENSYALQADCRTLPLDGEEVSSIMFDPPFTCGSRKNGKPCIIKERFGYYKNVPALWEFYWEAMEELERVLKPDGILVVKCQDTVESGKQWLSSHEITRYALRLGLYPIDVFVLVAKSRLISPNQRNQKHARKFHSYFLVFKKVKCRINYS